jgi:site-specific DNA recombinase
MTAVAIYARYSSDQQRDASIEDQIRLCQERAAREGWRVRQCYTDHAISGASLIRPGVQALLQDAYAGQFEIILAESIDRLSRDQEDIAGIYKRLRFADVRLVTLSEGDVSELHVGLKGTMAALYLRDLADKTRRGLRGRVEAGKSGGGNSYGYDVVKRFADDGSPIRGDRAINAREAGIVRRIFEDYARGDSPRTIAARLNREKVPGPSGRGWGASTIHGHRERGTGILNNELYAGRIVWNRLRYIKDPSTGKRVSRINPVSEWINRPVPDLRIIDNTLWDAARSRQARLVSHRKSDRPDGFWDRRRPRTLFSGLLKCSCCGGGFVKVSQDRFGCATARNKGTCGNMLTIRRDAFEATILDGLQRHLMDPALCEVFAEEYTRHMNRLRIERTAARSAERAELSKIDIELDRVVQAIMDGVPGKRLAAKAAQLEDRKAELEKHLAAADDDSVLLHPNMASRYRDQVAALREALTDGSRRAEASELIRGLVERVEFPPENGTLAIDLYGHLAGILNLASGNRKPAPNDRGGLRVRLVAGIGFEPMTFRL